tara:strand:+ start:2007 stop:3377 length:1371 start_codon:yes stop_codon:yes gene_type:complete
MPGDLSVSDKGVSEILGHSNYKFKKKNGLYVVEHKKLNPFLKKAAKVVLPIVTTALLTTAALKAEQISGNVDDVHTDEPIPELVVGAEGLGESTTNDNGHYNIPDPNSVRMPNIIITKPLFDAGIFNVLGQEIYGFNKTDGRFHWNGRTNSGIPASSGIYYLWNGGKAKSFFHENGESNIITLSPPDLTQRIDNKGGHRTASIRNFTILGNEVYHDLSRMINIGDSTLYHPFMIPIEEREEEDWVYRNTLEGFKRLFGLATPRPSDLPLPIWIYEDNIPEPNDSVDYIDILSSVIEDFNRNGNWYDEEFNILRGDFPEHDSANYADFPQEEIERIGEGVVFNFLNSPYRGGNAYTHLFRGYEDDTNYLFIVDINRNLDRAPPITLRGVSSRELFRVIGGNDNSPHNSSYISANEAVNVGGIHPQEEKIIRLCWDINRRCPTKYDWPDIHWYQPTER